MLRPEDRQLFVEALKPPEGYSFDRGIGTTFSLDLLALLVTPLSLSLFDRSTVEEALSDPLLLMEGLRRNADRLSIFCQAGYIAIPPKDNFLYHYLEDIIVQVKSPNGGVFHPKVWLLRYVSEDQPIIYRLLNLSRNLSFDRSWDVMVQVEGEVANRQSGYSRNRPLSDFISYLPHLSTNVVPPRIQRDIDLLQDEVRRVDFRLSYPFENHPRFYPIGIPGYKRFRLNDDYSRIMVISPFLTNQVLTRITQRGSDHFLISSISSIDEIPKNTRQLFSKIFILDDIADLDEGEISLTQDNDHTDVPKKQLVSELSGLHAKIYIMEYGWNSRWIVGSANATSAAFNGSNVEFMLEINGKKSQIGIDKILADTKDEFSFLNLLRPYQNENEVAINDTAEKQAEYLVDTIRRYLVDLNLKLRVLKENNEDFSILLTGDSQQDSPPGRYSISCWPITVMNNFSQRLDIDKSKISLEFTGISIYRLTPFLAIEVEAAVENAKHISRFVLNLPIENVPENRKEFILSAIIEDQGHFLSYLHLLLSGDNFSLTEDKWSPDGAFARYKTNTWEELDFSLFEDLIRALSRSPQEKIDRIAEIVDQLRRTPEGKQVIPESFDYLWEVLLQARKKI